MIQKRKEGLPVTPEEPAAEAQNGQTENGTNGDSEDEDIDDPGFVTSMGNMPQSTPRGSQGNLFDNAEKLDTLLTLEGILTLKIKEIEQLAKNGDVKTAKIMMNDLEKNWNNFNQEFESVCKVTGEYEKIYCDVYQQIAQRYFQTVKNFGEPINKITQKAFNANEISQLKLEPLKIPKFKGTYESWPTFSSLFDTLIISNGTLTNVQRMQYLKSVVTEEAERAIASLSITDENFEKAWKILTERFDNKHAIIDNQLQRIFELGNVPGNSSRSLRTFHDQSKEYFVMLKNVSGEKILIHVLKSKLDKFTRSLYQQQVEDKKGEENSEFFFEFLHKRCRVMESMEFKQYPDRDEKKPPQFKSVMHVHKSKEQTCSCCGKNHAIYFCEKFKSMKVSERSEFAKSKALCVLCLRANHRASECSYKSMCPTCGKKHNGLLHFENNKYTKKAYLAVQPEIGQNNEISPSAYTVGATVEKTNTLLATGMIRVKTTYGWSEVFRVLIDQGSMLTFITERAVKILNLKQTKDKIDICGIAGSVESSKGTVDIELTARYPTSFRAKVTAVVLSKLTTLLPSTDFDKNLIKDNRLMDLILADPHFNRCGKIDFILGADIYSEIIMNGMIKAEDNAFVAQETEIGWIISGPISKRNLNVKQALCMVATTNEIDNKLQKFWEIEEIGEHRDLTEEEQICVNHFEKTIKRGPDGVYSVALPFKKDAPSLGDSRKMALAQFFQLERKFVKDPNLKILYSEYMEEMLKRGYLKKCESNNAHGAQRIYYLPHHPVYKKSTTTKVRPVFNASMKTTNGKSLNDILITGPRLQEELFSILARFRTHKIGFSADIEKMYLHVNLDEQDCDCQRIIWRKDSTEPLQDYELTTVTFGLNCSPFLAVAVVQHHAKQESSKWPEACKIITEDSYMDDVSSGCEEAKKAIRLQKQVTQVLANGGFPLRKWISNSSELMQAIPTSEKDGISIESRNGYDKFVTTLGVPWFFESDKIGFKYDIEKDIKKLTKRTVLSELLSIFDPLGLLSPVTIYNKILMQKIWQQKIDWDDEVDSEIKEKWLEFREQLPIIEKLRAPRWLNCSPGDRVELIGFSDASEAAIGACVYLKSYTKDDIHVTLLASKTKVAPLKKVTLPRLELCAAELLTKLMTKLKIALKIEIQATHYYSDSKIALAWIKSDPCRWKTFVANRVSRIQTTSKPEEWHYINTKANPADFASRGLLPMELMDNKLWWYGPSVLLNDETYQHDGFETDVDEKRTKTIASAFHVGYDTSIFDRFSSLTRAIRTVAVCMKFTNQLKNKNKSINQNVLQMDEAKEKCKNFVLSTEDLEKAKLRIISMYQEKYFSDDICSLRNTHEVGKKSKLLSLYPFLDSNGILRVGGRLQNSEFSYNKKHPIIIPYGCKLMELIIDDAHKHTLHGGNQLTLAQIRHEFWIIGAKRAVKKYINSCVTCHRFRKSDSNQLMGSLPNARTKVVTKAFTFTGVDLCGPIQLKIMKTRGATTQKGYIVLFVCLSTRAVHIEIVVDLTSEAFIAAFKRFIGRRGNVAHLYSDNGTNFVGANKILKIESEQAMNDYNVRIQKELINLRTKFHFNPSLSPWMGGIWERGIGSIKYHLKRTIKDRVLTYEQLSTVLIQIEAILNSRPITPLNENPDDLDVLTPGHFLVGAALTSPIEPNLKEIKENRLSDWQLCVRLKQEFWEKWGNDYISQLQLRSKWKNAQMNLAVGDMVLVKEENMAPMHWPLGRVMKIYPGKDDLVRVVDVLMKGKQFKRPIVKLAPLPKKSFNLEEEIDEALEKISGKSNGKNSNSLENPQENKRKSEIILDEVILAKKFKKSENLNKSQNLVCNVATINDCDESLVKTRKKSSKKTTSFISCGVWSILVAMVLCFLSLFTPAHAHDFSIQPFATGTTAYLEKCNNVTEITGYWNLALHTNLDNYYRDVDNLHEALDHLESLCLNGTVCTQVTTLFKRKLDIINTNERFIKNEISIRGKRSMGMFVLGSLLGATGISLYNWILNSREIRYQNELLEKQTSIIDLTVQQLEEFHDTLNKTSIHGSNETWATAWLVSLFNHITETQNKILNQITKGTVALNTDELPLELLINNIKTISIKIEKNNSQLFGDTSLDKAMNVYKLGKISKTITVKNSLITIIKIPMIKNSYFSCLKIKAIPFVNNEIMEIIKIQYEYVLSNQKTNEYCVQNRHEMQNCLDLNEVTFCEINKSSKQNSSLNCELGIAMNRKNINCNKFEYDGEEFVEKIEANTWLYSVYKANIAIKCDNKTHSEHLSGSGLLKFDPQCEIKINNIILHTLENERSDLNINNDWQTVTLTEMVAEAANSLSKLKEEVRELKYTQKMHHFFHAHHTVILYLFIGWIAFCIILIFVRKQKDKVKHPNITI